jgi:Zierdtviridae exonuclease
VSTQEQTSNLVFEPPTLPSKWDIIPIHTSDRGSFKRCRRFWNYNSPSRMNLVSRADIFGINTDLFFGTGIHYALEQYYQPGLQRDPVESWQTWYDIQWNGGTVTEEWLGRCYDLNPQTLVQRVSGNSTNVHHMYKVRGLADILPDPDPILFDELRVLGIEMMKFYKAYAESNDDFEIVVAEHDFSVPIWDFDNDAIMQATDTREDSPNYGKKLEVHARGRMDNIYTREGKWGIIDHKTASRIDDDYFRKLETDEQCTSYLWAAEVEGKYYDLPWNGQAMEEVIYQALRKTYPRPPTVLKNGMFSIDRQNESTTIGLLQAFIDANGLAPIVADSEKLSSYVDYVREGGDEQFIIRAHARRNRHQLVNAGKRIFVEAKEMLTPDLPIYPNITNDFKCLNCQFRAPCIAEESGADWEQMIKDGYVSNRDR